MSREQITPDEQRLVAPVYASAVVLTQYKGPSTSRRYAQIPGVGLYSWSLGSAATIDGVDVIGHTGGYSGRWLRVSVDDGVVRTHESVRAVITSGAATGLVHDGVTLTAGQRVLRAVGTEVANGIYLAAAGAHTRASDMPAAGTVALGGIVHVLEGSASNVGLWRMSAPTTGTVTVGTTAVVWEQAGGSAELETRAFSELLDHATASYRQTYSAGGTAVMVLPPPPYVVGTETETFFADTTDAIDLTAFDTDASAPFPVFVVGVPYGLYTVAVSTTEIMRYARVLVEADATALTIVSADVDGADLDRLVVVPSVEATVPDGTITGISLAGTMAVARTVTSIVSGKGSLSLTFGLSGDLDPGDTPTLVIAETTNLKTLAGIECTSGSTPITITTVYDYASMTGLTSYMVPQLGNGSLADGAVCASWTSQAGTAAPVYTAAGGERPTFRADKGGMPAMQFDGAANFMATTDTIADIFNDTTGLILCAIWVEAINVAANQATVYQNVGLVADSVGYVGAYLKTDPEIRGYVFDGSVEQSPASACSIGAWHIVGARWNGGNLYSMVDGTWSAGEALDAGITSDLTQVMRIGRGSGAGLFYQGWFGQILTADAIPVDLADVVTSLKGEYGVA